MERTYFMVQLANYLIRAKEDTRGKGKERKLNLRDFWERFRSPLLFQALSSKSGAYRPLSRGGHFVSRDLKSFIYARLAS